jgi:hypothetical protein
MVETEAETETLVRVLVAEALLHVVVVEALLYTVVTKALLHVVIVEALVRVVTTKALLYIVVAEALTLVAKERRSIVEVLLSQSPLLLLPPFQPLVFGMVRALSSSLIYRGI